MSIHWENRAAPQEAYTRRARLIVEAVDAATGEIVWDGLRLKVEGIEAKPRVSSSGRFVWFQEPRQAFDKLKIDVGSLPYLPTIELPIPPPDPSPPPPDEPIVHSFMRVELAPSAAYPFNAGLTVLRGTLMRNVADNPRVFLGDASVRLRWIDDNAPGETWRDAPTVSRTDAKGSFAAIARLATSQIARADGAHQMRVRLAFTRAGTTKFSTELQIPFDQVKDWQQLFAWDSLLP